MPNEQNSAGRFAPSSDGVDGSPGLALYVKIANIFRFKITSKAWPAGYQLPPFEIIAAQFKVSRITVRQAVAVLVREGLLSATRGKGTFVKDVGTGTALKSTPSVFPTSIEEEDLEIRILYQRQVVEMPPEFVGGFVADGDYTEITKVHLLGGRPFAMMRIFIPSEILKRFPKGSLAKQKVFNLVLAQEGVGEYLEQTTTVEPADYVLSDHLKCDFGLPVAKVVRRLVGTKRELSYAGISWYRGDRFVTQMVFSREAVQQMPHSMLVPSYRDPEIRDG